MSELKNIIWQEKYRPNNVKDIISPHKNEILKAMENPLSMQNFIFYSRMGGTGKTSMSKAMVNDLECDVLSLNASDERSIETIRTKVKDFMMMQSSNPNSKKCIMMDEGEKLTSDAQDAIKNMMEEYSRNCFVILTTNNIHKIKEPLQTRFKIIEFIRPDKQEIYKYLENICVNENIIYNTEGLQTLIDIYYPSIRKMVNHLQSMYNEGKNVEVGNIRQNFSYYENIWTAIKQQQYQKVKKDIIENGVDCDELNGYIFDRLIDGDLDVQKEVKIIQILAQNERDFKQGVSTKRIFISSIPKIINAIKG